MLVSRRSDDTPKQTEFRIGKQGSSFAMCLGLSILYVWRRRKKQVDSTACEYDKVVRPNVLHEL